MNASDFPAHKAGLVLMHQPHRIAGETVEQHINDIDPDEWASPEQRQKAIDTDCLWTVQWYPDTPVGSCLLAAADLDVLLRAAREME